MKFETTRPSSDRHARAVRVEDSHDADLETVLAVVVHEEGLRDTLALVVAAPESDRIHVPPVLLALRVDVRIAVDFRGGRLKDARARSLRESEHIDHAHGGTLDRLDRIVLIVDGRRRARHVVDLVDLDEERIHDVVTDRFEARCPSKCSILRREPVK